MFDGMVAAGWEVREVMNDAPDRFSVGRTVLGYGRDFTLKHVERDPHVDMVAGQAAEGIWKRGHGAKGS